MGERPKIAPPAVNISGVSDQTALVPDDQSLAKSLTPALFAEFWPPSGWPMFACVTRPSGTVMTDQAVLKYDVRMDQSGVYTIEILSGTINRRGETTVTPVLGIRFSGREDWYEKDPRPEDDVLDVYSNGQRLESERSVILRMILAMTFLISRIDRGLMPNLKKTLKIYRLSSESQ
jgi:hypothetical protein